jgi:hypothetical protein
VAKFYADINKPNSLYFDFENITLYLFDPERMKIVM